MTRILIYGFGPYLNFENNITQRIVEALKAVSFKDFEVQLKTFDVKFSQAMFLREVKQFKPDYVLGMGQHPRARRIRIERRGVNLKNNPQEDSQPIKESGQAALHTSLKVSPCEGSTVTYDAGTYVCNFSMYTFESNALKFGYRYAFFHMPRNLEVSDGVQFILRVLSEL